MLVSLDEHDSRPLYQQMVAQIKQQVQRGELEPGDELPPVRELADSLGVNLHTVRNAYMRLRDEGVVDLRLGRRARVARRRPTATAEQIERLLGPKVRELVADAFILGLSPQGLFDLIDRQVNDESIERHWETEESE